MTAAEPIGYTVAEHDQVYALPPHPGDNWEGGATDARGRRWIHVPWQGWEFSNHAPYLVPRVPHAPWWKRWRP